MVTLQGYDDRASMVEVFDPRTRTSQHIVRYDLRELLPLLRHRWQPNQPDVKKIFERDRNLRLSIDARLQLKAADLLENQLRQLGRTKGAVVVLDPEDGDLLTSVSYPWPNPALSTAESNPDDALLDRARYGLYPPGSSFKIVTAIAALRKDAKNADQVYECKRLPDGRTGAFIEGWKRPIHDDIKDTAPHGAIAMRAALVASCNAYFAQLGTYKVGPEALLNTASQLGISVANPSNVKTLRGEMPQTSYGQGQVVATPFQMARVAATIAHGGSMPFGRWVTDQTNPRRDAPQTILSPELSSQVGEYMRSVVTSGTGRSANLPDIPMAGKTGTAELEHAPSHAWFIGFAPYGASHKLAFSVLIENGQYGGTAAAPLAAEVMKAAKALGYARSAMSRLHDLERRIDEILRGMLRSSSSDQKRELLEIHRALLNDVTAHVDTLRRGKQVFSYTQLKVLILLPDPALQRSYELAFVEGDALARDMRLRLEDQCVELPAHLAVEVELVPGLPPEVAARGFDVHYGSIPHPAAIGRGNGGPAYRRRRICRAATALPEEEAH